MNDKTGTWEGAVQWLRDQPDQQELVRAAFYDDPLTEAAKRFSQSSEWKAVQAYLPTPMGEKCLDLGAGRGIASYALARDGWQVTALEPDPSELVGAGAIRQLAEENDLDIEIIETWGESLPFDDASFDAVHCRQVLHHANNLVKLCQEIARVLRPGGVMIATREHVISRKEDLEAFLDSHPLHHLYGGEHAYLLEDYKRSIVNAGLKLEKVLNPFASDINLYPQTIQDVKNQVAGRLRIPARIIPDIALRLFAAINKTPGRLYSFVARKSDD
jgi:Methylase involved in ubiquinone/menaquinone biosynthesis